MPFLPLPRGFRTGFLSTCVVLVFGMVVVDPAAGQSSVFDQWDRDGDGKLARDELPSRLRGNFDRADADGDGFISRDEDARFRAKLTTGKPSVTRPDTEGARTVLDIPYAGSDNPRQRLDLYLPLVRSSKKPMPVIVFIHGGGWRKGDRRSGRSRVLPFVQSGRYAGVSVGYRLSDEAQWPAQIHDCKAAIRWIRAHAARYSLNGERVGVWGMSAGGHLVAMLGTSAGVPSMDGQLGPKGEFSTRVSCVVDFFGPTDFLQMDAHRIAGTTFTHNRNDSPESLLVGGSIQEHADRVATANPITYVTGDDPPFLIMHGVADSLVPLHQSQILERALSAAHVDVTLVPVPRAGHGLRGVDTSARVSSFFEKHLLGATDRSESDSLR